MFSRTFTGIIASPKGGGVVLTQGILYDDPNYPANNGPSACNPTPLPPPNPPPSPIPYDIWYTGTLLTGDFVYADSAGVTPWPLGWWKINVIGVGDTAVELNGSGEILTTFSC